MTAIVDNGQFIVHPLNIPKYDPYTELSLKYEVLEKENKELQNQLTLQKELIEESEKLIRHLQYPHDKRFTSLNNSTIRDFEEKLNSYKEKYQ